MATLFHKFLQMVYPMLISLFLLLYTDTNTTAETHDAMMIVTIVLTLLFGILFFVGLFGTIFASDKNESGKAKR